MSALTRAPRARRMGWIAVVGALLALAPSAHAQLAVDRLELFLRPGASDARSGVLMVRNEGSERSQALVRLEDWDRTVDGTNRFFTAGALPGSCAGALRVFPSTISLAPGESQAIRVDLDAVRAGDMRSECWSIVVVQAQQPVKQAGGRTLLYTLRTGMKVYVAPDGLHPEGDVTDVRVTTPASASRDTAAQVEVTFRNTGRVHLSTQGRIEIRREDNSLVAVTALPAMHALPGAESVASVRLPPCPTGRYTILAIVDYGGTELAAAQLDHLVP